MKHIHLITGAILATAGLVAPTMSFAAADADFGLTLAAKGATVMIEDDTNMFAKRGRGRGRGGDDRGRDRSDDRKRDRSSDDDNRRDRSDDRPSRRDDSNSGRSRPRVPGGSGCDDPGDLLEHPECRG